MGNKMVLVKDLVHDLSNKISIIQGKAVRMQRTNCACKDLDSIILNTSRAIELLMSLKNTVSTDGEIEVDVDNAVESSTEMFRTLERAYQLKIDVSDLETQRVGASIHMDMQKVTSIFENVCANAAKAGATKLTLSDRIVGNTVVSTFTDNGRGCANTNQIGTGYTEGGTGQGTQMIIRYMTEMGGTAKWESILDGGMRVILTFRLVQQNAAKAA